MQKLFITRTELLLVCYDHGRRFGIEWIGTPGQEYTDAAAVLADYNDDDIVAFRRIDLAADPLRPGVWGEPEDITEDVASSYIERYQGLRPEDEDAVPAYVSQSSAWTDFVDDYDSSDPARAYGTLHTSRGRMA